MVLMADNDRVSLTDIGIVEVPPFKQRSEQNQTLFRLS